MCDESCTAHDPRPSTIHCSLFSVILFLFEDSILYRSIGKLLVLEDDTEIEIDLFGWTIYWYYKDKDEKKVQLIQQVIVVIRKINWNNNNVLLFEIYFCLL